MVNGQWIETSLQRMSGPEEHEHVRQTVNANFQDKILTTKIKFLHLYSDKPGMYLIKWVLATHATFNINQSQQVYFGYK